MVGRFVPVFTYDYKDNHGIVAIYKSSSISVPMTGCTVVTLLGYGSKLGRPHSRKLMYFWSQVNN